MEERRDAPRRAATRDDWEINEMPAECAHIKLTRRFSESELEALKLGHVPAEMEDHWFCYWEDGRLFIHRSWTGNCIYVLKVASRGSTHDVTVNRFDRQYTCTSIDEDLETLNSLLNGWTGSYHPLKKNTGGLRTVFHKKRRTGSGEAAHMRKQQRRLRAVSVLLSAVMLTGALTSCGGNAPDETGSDTLPEEKSEMQTIHETQAAPVTEAEETQTQRVPQGTLTLHTPSSPVYLCNPQVRAYIDAGGEADVTDFDYHCSVQAEDVEITWEVSGADYASLTLEISESPDYADAEQVTLKAGTASHTLRFLKRDTTYYLRLSTVGTDVLTAEGSFTTAYAGPRFLNVGGLYHNCRDLGGYRVGGKVTVYDLVIRGSSPDNCSEARSDTLTKDGKTFLEKTVGIRTQLDLRGTGENAGRTDSSFRGASYVHVPLTAYAACFSPAQAELYRQAFSLFADPANYPIYFHCVGGADRTGTVSALLLALLGVDEGEIVQDYVVTSFSPVCFQQDARSRENIMAVLDGLKAYSGETLAERCASFLHSIGVTQQEIFSIRAILFGEDPNAYVPVADYGILPGSRLIDTESGKPLTIKLNEEHPVSEIRLGGASLPFSQAGLVLTVPADALASLADGVHEGCVVFEDGHESRFTVNVNFIDLTGDLQVTGLTQSGDYTYVTVTASSPVFNGVDYHFHTRRDSIFPDVETHILLNGQTIAHLNDSVDLSGREWVTSPGKGDPRHRVPVSILATGSTMKLLIRADWLEEYLNGGELTVTLQAGLRYTTDEGTFRVLSDVTYRYTGGIWVKVV